MHEQETGLKRGDNEFNFWLAEFEVHVRPKSHIKKENYFLDFETERKRSSSSKAYVWIWNLI